MPKRDATRSLSLTSQESYSAVIIADMVAEVRTESEQDDDKITQPSLNGSSKVVERINPAFDVPLDATPAAVVDVELVEKGKRNGASDITKGVILNATQFGHADRLVPDPLKMASKGEVDIKHMSVPRKIAFGISFLPSIMFVLCFAVLLPCKMPVPCMEEVWTLTLYNTAVTSGLVVSGSGLFYASISSSDKSIASGASLGSGSVSWTADLDSPSHLVQCDHLEDKDTYSCLVAEDNGQMRLFNASNGHLQWKRNLRMEESSLPTILPDCNGDGVSEVALGVTGGQVKVLMNGAILFTVNVTECDSVPLSLTPWQRTNGNDLIFICRKGNEEKLVKVPESRWCLSNKKSMKEDILTLESRGVGVLERSVLLPTEDGLVLWVEDDVIMFEVDGQQRWKASSSPHSTDNRFLLHGKFNTTDVQVALFSSSLRSTLRVTTLSCATGEMAWSKEEPNSKISDVSFVHGKEKDFALVSFIKVRSSLASGTLDTLEAVSSTIMSVLAKEDINDTASSSSWTTEKIAFLEFGSKFLLPIEEKVLSNSEGGLFKSSTTVVQSDSENADTISIIVSRNPTDNSKGMTSQLRRIDVANWDISISKESECKWKQ